MIGTKTKAKAGAKGTKVGAKAAKQIIKEPALRNAVSEIAPPVAKFGVNVGKRRIDKKTRKQLEQLGDTVNAIAHNYVPQAAEMARELGLVEQPKEKATLPRVLFGAAIGAALMFVLEPGHGGEHRQQIAKLLG